MNEFLKYYSKNNFLTRLKFLEINRLYELSPEKLLDKYNIEFLSLFRKAIQQSEFYKSFYKNHGINISDIKDLTDINKLPIIDRSCIKNDIENIFIGFNFLKIKGLTSGTSGSPLTLLRTPFDIAKEQAYIRHYREMHGFKSGQPLLSIRGFLGKNAKYEFYKKANILYLSSPNINQNTIEMYYDMILKFGPIAIEAFPSYLFKFVTELEKKGLSLNVPLSFTSSETLLSFQRVKIESFLKTIIYDWYGNAERSILLAQDSNMKYYPLPLYSINEFNDNNIVTTSLINNHFPLIRYKVEDRITVKSNDFLKNLITPDIENITGRASDNLELKDGSIVGCIDHAFKGVKNLEMAQVHQYNVNDPIEIKIVVDEAFKKSDEEQLKSNLIRMLGESTDLIFTYCKKEDLVFSENKKFRLIIKVKPE